VAKEGKSKVIIFIVFPWRAKGELSEEKREHEGKGLKL